MGFRVSSAPMSFAGPVTTLKTPAGIPASRARTARARAENGVWAAGFITTGQPAASAGAALRVIMAEGKFQGVIAAQTPTGCLITRIRFPGCPMGMVSPYTRLASSANHSTKPAPYKTSPRDSANGFPCSVVMIKARSSWCLIMRSCQFRIIQDRCRAVIFRQAGQAASAASMAQAVSARPREGTVPTSSPVAGLYTVSVVLSAASIHFPATKHWLQNSSCFFNFIQYTSNHIRKQYTIQKATSVRHSITACFFICEKQNI